MSDDLSQAIRAALLTGEARPKVIATRQLMRDWRRGRLASGFSAPMPDRPAWPARLEVMPPSRMPRRGGGGTQRSRIAQWHSLAHIEFVAIDLALDMAGRFGAQMGDEFIGDFLRIAAEEAMHFAVVSRHLGRMGASYGDLPVHDGLWQAAADTAHDVAARLAVVPLVLEARGLDATPAMIERMRAQGDEQGARILERILDDEIGHVAAGTKHFFRICAELGLTPRRHWKKLVTTHFAGRIMPPFNDSARLAAGLPRDFYAPVA